MKNLAIRLKCGSASLLLTLTLVSAAGAEPGASSRCSFARQEGLWELVRDTSFEQTLPVANPQPFVYFGNSPPAVSLCSTHLLGSLWGPANALTVSISKPDVFDRRVIPEEPLTLARIREGCFDPANASYDTPPLRGRYEYHLKNGGGLDRHYKAWHAHDYPCAKPVGQIVVKFRDFEGHAQPRATVRNVSGLVELALEQGDARAQAQYLSMKSRNLIAIKTHAEGIQSPMQVRLFRHQDTCQPGKRWLQRSPDVKGPEPLEDYDYAKDAAIDVPIEPPEVGVDGEYFWLKQTLPAESTFPDGFYYVLVARIKGATPSFEVAEGEKYLGTLPDAGQQSRPPYLVYAAIREAPGWAVTATLPSNVKDATVFATVATLAESEDPMSEARRRLDAAIGEGFPALVEDEIAFNKALCGKRESGRVFVKGYSDALREARSAVNSWRSEGSVAPYRCEPEKLQVVAGAYNLEQDVQPWHGLKCWNEFYFTSSFVRNRGDCLEHYQRLLSLWLPSAKSKARDVFDKPGMYIAHGYLPPIRPNPEVHFETIDTYSFCISTAAQMMKIAWDAWDYGGDEEVLRRDVYPALRELAIFYHAFVEKGDDGFYHARGMIVPERWGWTYRWKWNQDGIGAIAMIRWTLLRAAEAAEHLGADEELRKQWIERAGQLAPRPVWNDGPNGPIFAELPDIDPYRAQKMISLRALGGANIEQFYPTVLADEINLDSSEGSKKIMLNTGREMTGFFNLNNRMFHLLGAYPEHTVSGHRPPQGKMVLRKIETPEQLYQACNGEPERLLNSRSGRIHLFPCVPSWSTVAFRDFQARGGFLVSAEMIDGQTAWARITARRDAECRLKNPWPKAGVIVLHVATGEEVAATVEPGSAESVVFGVKKGEAYDLRKR